MSEIPSADWSWIHAIAERFEQAWKKGPRPRIEDFLATVDESCWPPLLEELLRVECELRRRDGEETNAEEYRQRFPDHDEMVVAVFASVLGGSRTEDQEERLGSTLADAGSAKALGNSLPPELANHPDYEIVRELARGGMGVVYLARNRLMERDEVLKVVGPRIVDQAGGMDRFLREIRAVAKLRHPNIVSAYTAFRCGKDLVFAMEYVVGLDLRRMVKARGALPVSHACSYVHQAALGLQHAHEEGMVHRDIKPGNLMLSHKKDRALIKVLDFGLSKAVSEHHASEMGTGVATLPMRLGEHLTSTGEMLGTPDFIAPEQIEDSQNADIRADIYSLGCTLHYLITGQPPFPDMTLAEVLRAHRSLDAVRLDELRPEVPADLSAVVAKMMAKQPDQRFQTPSAVASALAPFFKKPAAAAAARYGGVDQDPAPDAVRAAPNSAADSGQEVWSNLIDFRETEDDADAVATAPNPVQGRPRWLWTALAAGVLILGLAGAWAIAIFWSGPLQKGKADPDGAGVTIATAEESPIRLQRKPLVASEPSNSPPSAAEPSARNETSTPAAATTPAAIGGDAMETAPAVTEPMPPGKTATPAGGTTQSPEVFHEIAWIPSPDPVIQARLISGSGQVLFETGGRNRALWQCDLKDPEHPRKLEVEHMVPGWNNLAVSTDGRFAIVAGTDNSLWNLDLESRKWRTLLPRGPASIEAIALSPDNQLVAFVRAGTIQFRETNKESAGKRKQRNIRMGDGTELIAFSRDGSRILSSHSDHSIRVWNVKNGREIGQVTTKKSLIDLAVCADGGKVLTASPSPDPAIAIWDLENRTELRQARVNCASVAVSADGRRALIGGGKDMRLWDLLTGEELIREDHKKAVLQVAFSADDRQAVASTTEGVRVWALPSGRAASERPPVVLAKEFPNLGGIYDSVAVSRSGRWILTSGFPNFVRLWDRQTGEFVREFNNGGKRIWAVAISPDETRLLFGGEDKLLHCWNLESNEHQKFPGHLDHIASVAFSSDGRRAYSAGGFDYGFRDGTDFAVRVWDLESGQQLRPLKGHKATVQSLAVSADGRYLLSGGNDLVPILWDASTLREIERFRGHTGKIHCVAFVRDGRRAVSSSDDGTIRLWDIDRGRQMPLPFQDPRGTNGYFAVSPDGHRLCSSWGHSLWYWDLDTGKLVQELRWEEAPTKGSFTPDGRHMVWGGWGGILRMYRLNDIAERPPTPLRRSPNLRK